MPIANLPPHKLKKKGLSDEKYYIKFFFLYFHVENKFIKYSVSF